MSIEEKLSNLLTWIKTFQVARGVKSISEITDGVVIGQILNFISPAYFTGRWLAGISMEANEDQGIKCQNLKYVIQAMVEFLNEITDRQLFAEPVPDVMAIVYQGDEEAIFRLLQLVLGCAVNSELQEKHIQSIMSMQESVQHALMEAIQQLMPSAAGTYNDPPSPVEDAEEDCSFMLAKRDALAQDCHDLKREVSQLRDEKGLLESEIRQLRKTRLFSNSSIAGLRMVDGDGTLPEDMRVTRTDNSLSPTAASVRISQLQDHLTRLRTELYEVETVKYEQGIRLTEILSENEDLRQKCELLAKRAEEVTQLKDEVDIAREELSRDRHTFANLDKLRRRADEAGELRTVCAKLEADNAVCLERMAELEQEARLSTNLRSQLETHRVEITNLRQEAGHARQRVESTEAELKLVRQELAAAVTEKSRLVYELNRRQNSCEELQICSLFTDNANLMDEDGTHFKNLHEDLHHLASSMSSLDVNSRCGRPQLFDAVTSTEPDSTPTTDGTVESHVVATLQAQPAETDKQIAQLEHRYRGYLWKAKEVIRLLDKQRRELEEQWVPGEPVVSDEVDRLRSLLVQKEAIIERLEQHHEQTRRQRDLEERVVVSAWYNLASHILRESDTPGSSATVNGASSQSASKSSLLARQREVHLKAPRGLTSIVMNNRRQ